MKSSFAQVLFASIVLLVPLLVVANLMEENEIDGDHRDKWNSLGRSELVLNCQGCSINKCQVMGMQRFSAPRCEPLGDLGAPCRMWQEPENKTLHFPNWILTCDNVYTQFCPCKPGLVCKQAKCSADASIIQPTHDHEQEDHEDVVGARYYGTMIRPVRKQAGYIRA